VLQSKRPDTLMQDRLLPARRNPLATHGRTIHVGQKRSSEPRIAMSAMPPKADIQRLLFDVRFVPCVDGSELARAFFTFAALVGAAMCSAFRCGSHDRWP
jgi:hypothetical protein